MIATFVNTMTIIMGSLLGILVHRGVKERYIQALMGALGLCVTFLGIKGAMEETNFLLVIVMMALGSLVGEWIDIDLRLTQFANSLKDQFMTKESKGNFVLGFVSSSLLFGVGAMAIVGSIQSGLHQNYDILFAKSLLDFIAAIALAATMGIGVMFSAFVILIYQGSITLLAMFFGEFLLASTITLMSVIGSLAILALGMNMLNATKLRVANMLPAVFLPIVWQQILFLVQLLG